MFKVFATENYLNELRKWSPSDRRILERLTEQLKLNPLVGKGLSYPFLREKKIRENRIYYLVYGDLNVVFLVATSKKKNQQETIDYIKSHLKEFRKAIEKRFKAL